jgi:3-methyladenine DNA glycosylase Tag
MQEVPAETALSRQRRSSSPYSSSRADAFMQAVGMVNDHLVQCHRHQALLPRPMAGQG